MNVQNPGQKWLKEYEEFAKIAPVEPPTAVSVRVLDRIRGLLNPPGWSIFFKLSVIHAVVGTVTLLFCPQFGISPLKGAGLMSVYMHMGPHLCMIACGATFLSFSALVTSILLSSDEVRKLRKWGVVQIGLLSLLSLVGFAIFGEEMVISFALSWYFGSVLSGVAFMELGWVVRHRSVNTG